MSRTSFRPTTQFSSDRSFGGAAKSRPSTLLLLVDLGLLAILLVVPFLMGGRQALGQLTFALLCSAVAGFWALHQLTCARPGWRVTWVEPLLIAGVGIVLLQTCSLPERVLHGISPHLAEVLSAWNAAASDPALAEMINGPWTRISLTPTDTCSALTQIVAGMLLFVVVSQRIRSPHDVRRLIKVLCCSALLMAVFGLVQLLTSNGKFFWFYEHPFSHTNYFAKGAFTNKNHFASFVGMALPLAFWWLISASGGWSRGSATSTRRSTDAKGIRALLLILSMGVLGVAVLLSQSRGGLIATCCGMLVTLVAFRRSGTLNGRLVGALVCTVVLAIVSLACFGEDIERMAEQSLSDLTSGDIDQMDRSGARRRIWAAVVRGIADYPVLGTGLASHREVYWTYFDHNDEGTEYSHAENGYLQVTLETGFVGLSLVGLLMLTTLGWCRWGARGAASSSEMAGVSAAIGGALCVNFVHSLGDFVWYVPACMGVVVSLAGCAAALLRLEGTRGASPDTVSSFTWAPVRRVCWGAALMGSLLLGVWIVRVKGPELQAEGYWHEYIRASRMQDSPESVLDRNELREHQSKLILAASRANPNDARLQLRAARAWEAQFELRQEADPDRMSLSHIREAALSAEFSSPEEMNEWLDRPGVIGEHRLLLEESMACARRALSLCPLLAQGYVQLAEHGWLLGSHQTTANALLVQALRVRPWDPQVNFVVGREGWRRDDAESALRYWRVAFQRDAAYQQEIINLLAPIFSAQQFRDAFEPDTQALVRLMDGYSRTGNGEEQRQVAQEVARRWSDEAEATDGEQASRLWCQICSLYQDLGDENRASKAAERAVEANPSSFAARSRLGAWLMEHEEFARAREHLVWCARRRPDDAALQQQAAMATRESLRNPIRLTGGTREVGSRK